MLNRDDRNNEHDIILAIKDKIKKLIPSFIFRDSQFLGRVSLC